MEVIPEWGIWRPDSVHGGEHAYFGCGLSLHLYYWLDLSTRLGETYARTTQYIVTIYGRGQKLESTSFAGNISDRAAKISAVAFLHRWLLSAQNELDAYQDRLLSLDS